MTRYNLIPAVFLILGTLLAIQLGNAVDQSHQDAVALETRITSEQYRFRLESCIDSRIAVINQLAEPKWASQAELRENFATEASTLFNLFSGIQALNYVTTDGMIEIIFPEANNTAALGANLLNHPDPEVPVAISIADQASRLIRTQVIKLLQGGVGIAMYQPISSISGEKLGFVNGVFRTNDLVETCLFAGDPLVNFQVTLQEIDGSMVYQSVASSAVSSGVAASGLVNVAGLPWQLELIPTADYLRAPQSRLEDYWLYVGILLVVLLAAAIRTLLLKQESLRDSQEKYRLLVENQSDFVVKLNTNFQFLYVSPNYCKTFGKLESEIVGASSLLLVHEDDQRSALQSLHSITPENSHSYHEQRTRSKDGWRWLAWSNTGIFDAEGKLVAIAAVGRDIHDMKKQKDDIAHNQKMQAIGEIASGITHDFNNLLQIMMANIEFLINDRDRGSDKTTSIGKTSNGKTSSDKTNSSLLEQIQKSLLRAQDLIVNLSTLSKQDVFLNEVIEINQFVKDVVEMFRQSLPQNISISLVNDVHQLHANIDATQFERVMLNLLINAREAMTSQGVIGVVVDRCTLEAEFCASSSPRIQPGKYIRITISDTGRGIPEANLARIFDPFFSTKESSKTSGLGLANSYAILKQLEGSIAVKSTPGKGTTFSVFLPQKTLAGADAPLNEIDNSTLAGETSKLILVVDDEAEISDITVQILRSQGYQTLSAVNGKEALEIFAVHRDSIALVILDLVMPVMSGQQAAVEIRKIAPEVNVLFISGYIPESKGRTIQLSAPLLRKPFRSAALLDKVDEILRQIA